MDDTLRVATPGGSYTIAVAPGAIDRLPHELATLGVRGRLWLVSHDAIVAAYGERIIGQLRAGGWDVRSHCVPAGEASKDRATLDTLHTWMIGGGIERRDVVLALGGGVIGDLAGFAAASVLRGVGFVQIPTTLLAMVDSAIGGKTGINHPLGKNLIGAFHQPLLVLADTETLATLPPRELSAGWAEAIKHGVIRDSALFDDLETRAAADISATSAEDLAALVRRAVRVKVDVVNVDERETGERMLLNYGHTLGHAIENAAGYGSLLHGEAVAIGMDLEAQLALRLGMVDMAFVRRQRAVLRSYGLPTERPAQLAPETLLDLTLRDKKVRAGKVRWVLPTAFGAAVVREDLPEHLVREVLAAPLV